MSLPPLFLITAALITLHVQQPHARASVEDPIAQAFEKLRRHTIVASPEIAAARAERSQKNAQLYSSFTRWLPRVDLQFSQIRSKDYSMLTSGTLSTLPLFANISPEAATVDSFQLTTTMPIYRRSVHVGLGASQAEAQAARAGYDTKLLEADWKLRQLMGAYLLDLYRERLLDRSQPIAMSQLKEAKLRFELGQSPALTSACRTPPLILAPRWGNPWQPIAKIYGTRVSRLQNGTHSA